jgi:chromosome segregation and condensation protein ScpB
MAATVDTEWQERVLALKAEGMSSAEIAEAVGKHAATVRKVIARAKNDEPWDGARAHSEGDAAIPAEDDPEHPDTLAEFRAEAGEAVGPMPPSRAVDPQDGMFDKVWEDANLLAVLEEREKTREKKLTASKAHKLKDDEAKALLAGYSLEVGEVARIGRFRIKKTRREGSEVSFTTEPREQLRIAVDSDD